MHDSSIYIVDGGNGMDDTVIERQWMTIGTDDKLVNSKSSASGRIKSGAKGIGRFALNRLGKTSLMLTAPIGKKKIYEWEVNWTDFEKTGSTLSDVGASLSIINSETFHERLKSFGLLAIMKTEYPKTYAYLKSQRETLYARDKGNGEKYPVWYQYGRTQSLTMPRYKLFFPKIADKPLNCILCDDKNLLLYNGMAFVSDNMQTLQILKRIIESTVFWEYITLNSKPYSAGYYALSGINIKNFCIPDFDEKAIMTLLSFNDKNDIDNFLRPYYRENT